MEILDDNKLEKIHIDTKRCANRPVKASHICFITAGHWKVRRRKCRDGNIRKNAGWTIVQYGFKCTFR